METKINLLSLQFCNLATITVAHVHVGIENARSVLDAARDRLTHMLLDEKEIQYYRETIVQVGVTFLQ